MLHAYIQHVCRVAGYSTKEPAGGRHSDEGREIGRGAGCCEYFFEFTIDAEAGG